MSSVTRRQNVYENKLKTICRRRVSVVVENVFRGNNPGNVLRPCPRNGYVGDRIYFSIAPRRRIRIIIIIIAVLKQTRFKRFSAQIVSNTNL